jgi:hypothetical protein
VHARPRLASRYLSEATLDLDVRGIPSTTPSGDGGSRPMLAVLLGTALLAGVLVVVTSGPASTAVTIRAEPADTVGPPHPVYDRSRFEFASPIHRAVTKAHEGDGTATVNATVEDPDSLLLGDDENERRFYVRVDGTAYEVTVERQ